MPKKEEIDIPSASPKRPPLERFWLQVDRQTKRSYATLEEAQTEGKVIKAAHPNLQVGIYDHQNSERSVIEA